MPFADVARHAMAMLRRYALEDSSFSEGAAMQMNENVGQAQPLKRLPDEDEAPIARRTKPETRAKRPDADASPPVVSQPPEITVEPKRYPRWYGAGF